MGPQPLFTLLLVTFFTFASKRAVPFSFLLEVGQQDCLLRLAKRPALCWVDANVGAGAGAEVTGACACAGAYVDVGAGGDAMLVVLLWG